MTETERLIGNEQVLDLVDEQVSKVESELSRLAGLQEDLHASRDTVGKLSLENKRLRDNVDGLDKSKRVTKLQSNAAAISLEENDALTIERSIAATRERVTSLGQATKSSCAEILWALSAQRRSNARTALESVLDFTHVGAFGQSLELSARSVLELKDLEYYFRYSATAKDAGYLISLLGQLRENFSELRTRCELEPSLIIPPVAVAPPVESPIAEYEPAITGNHLGSLAEAITR
jgi:predicted RNase H-like nuclease (RuvC/YqgF family)